MKSKLLAGAVAIAAPAIGPTPTVPIRKAPIPMIGVMGKNTTRDQRTFHHRMKMDMKKAARNIRYGQLQKDRDDATE